MCKEVVKNINWTVDNIIKDVLFQETAKMTW